MLESNLNQKKKSPQRGGNHAEGKKFLGTESKGSRRMKTFNVNHLLFQAGGLCRSLLQPLAETAVFVLLALLFASGRSM